MSGAIRAAVTLTQDWHRVPGGTAVAANALAAALAARTDVVPVGVVPPRGAPTAGFEPPVDTVALRLAPPWLYDAWSITGRPRISAVVPGVDLVHFTLPVPPPRERVPLVATVHDVLPITEPGLFTRRGSALMRRGLRRIASDAAMVMVPSGVGRDEFVRVGFDPARVTVVPLGVDPPAPTERHEVDAVLARLGVEPPYVLFVGTAEPRKGLDVLAGAMAQLDRDELTLVLVGPQGWGAHAPAPPGRVVRTGYLPAPELRALRAGAAVCALPSRAEGFGLPVLEAMAAGAPVVTTAGTPMEEFARDVALFVPPAEPAQLADAIASVLDDRGLAARMASAGPRRALEYTWERAAERVVEVYREVLG